MTIYFVSLISRDDRPLYIQPFSPYDPDTKTKPTTTEEPGDKKDVKPESTKENKGKDEVIEDPETHSFVDESKNVNELLKYNFLSHMALDIFESPFASLPAQQQQYAASANKIYQLLFVQDGIFVFGQETNTGLKIVLGCSRKENDDVALQSSEGLNPVFKDVHRAYLRLICNPFRSTDDVDQEIENPRFDKRVKEIVNNWNETH
ncbi:unnamed protein product [Ambrosiozyma monospora]|uniref:Unnamed protein product n=1 Tax=Ambrosiozyma monospora TaxID=43982 RepID=A0ACB5SYE0_AMBMO|nr:unnamed protein product [Ambrosiozyma monospora]